MKFMIVGKASAETEAGALPSQELVDDMHAYNEELTKAGVLLAAEGLYSSSYGAQIAYSGGKASVIDGPFTEAKELIAGFWLIQVKSREEAIEWALRVPVPPGAEGVGLDVWRVFDASDVPDDSLPPAERAREEALRERLGVDDTGA
ncbi:YciI family protein [Nonomuraea gerenzanensis]|uniref:PhnB protein n=1 Tax=Nonomuraea gerenzanensis TaxID=93944 RepID=A0A1M4E874_9ACTN|nr:YciI family protein [Nonomuraea gerenzanensis]UBU17272.1 YciI family protein [Nonomuraea gerenzanensis]SBO95016.1 PhnB protein [Nonomuraea gerenzanensis]